MSRTLGSVAVLVGLAITLAATATGGAAASKQRVGIGVTGGLFVLTPLTAGAIKRDTGVAGFCCWSSRHIMRAGQAIELNNPQMTLTGKRGTLVVRNQIEWVDIPDGWAVFTGTWKVVRGTGDYAGLSGGGRGAGVAFVSSNGKSRFEGFLSAQ
jgi:hypothetical protein